MTDEPEVTYILSAEHVGNAEAPNGELSIGTADENGDGVVRLQLDWGWYSVFVRRSSSDLSIMEIHMARHDGLAAEELDRQNEEAERYPLGQKEYWRGRMVGRYQIGIKRAEETGRSPDDLMTDEDFEDDWYDDHLDDDL